MTIEAKWYYADECEHSLANVIANVHQNVFFSLVSMCQSLTVNFPAGITLQADLRMRLAFALKKKPKQFRGKK